MKDISPKTRVTGIGLRAGLESPRQREAVLPSPASSAASRPQNRGRQSTTPAGVPAATGRRMGGRRGRLLGAGEETGGKHPALESLEAKEEEFVGKLWKAGEQRAPGLRPPAGAPACWLLGPGGLHPHGRCGSHGALLFRCQRHPVGG